MAALLAGQSISEIAKEYKIPEGTVYSWKSRQENNEAPAILAREKKEEIGNLLLSYLSELLTTLKIQVVTFRDKDWLKQQSASEVAVLHGVIADKGIRILEALADSDKEV